MLAVEAITNRPIIIYAVDMASPTKTASSPLLSMLNYEDKDAFIEAMRGLSGDSLDVLLQSPGGLAEATESIVVLLRSHFKHVRFIVPSIAKSAATMLALSGDEILMSIAAELGPIDPQMQTGRGVAPAQAILDQFEQARQELKRDPASVPAWLPILQQYGPSLLQDCQNHLALAEDLVSSWLASYMFRRERRKQDHAREVADKLNEHGLWRSHSRRIDLDWLKREARLRVSNLADTPQLDDAVRGLHLAIKIAFSHGTAFKIVQNAHGGAFIGHAQVAAPMPFLPAAPPASTPPSP